MIYALPIEGELMKSMKKKRSQVALEFLVTYGWAILASMIAIGALTYFGITNPSRTMPDKCIFSNNFLCDDYMIRAPDAVSLKLVNGQGQSLYSPSATVTTPSGSNACTFTSAPAEWVSDQVQEVTCTVTGAAFLAKDKAKAKISITYKRSVTGYDQLALGEVYSTVQT